MNKNIEHLNALVQGYEHDPDFESIFHMARPKTPRVINARNGLECVRVMIIIKDKYNV